MSPTRIEHDLLGDRAVPAEAYYGIHTLRALENFAITGTPISHYPDLVNALACVVDVIQGGAGTSTNMNANEVICNRALEILGHKKASTRTCTRSTTSICRRAQTTSIPPRSSSRSTS
jgi:aspartate ammonia-lyase